MDEISSYIRKFERTQQNDTESTNLAREMYTFFGKKSGSKVYPLFTSPRYTHRQIKDAWATFKKTGNSDWKYFCGILNHLK